VNTILTSTSGGLDAAAIKPFFHSLRLSGCNDEVVVFASDISPECRALLKDYQAKVVDFDYRGIRFFHGRSQRLSQGFKAVYRYYRTHRAGQKEPAYLFFNNARFFYYRDYLSGLRDKPDRVLLADIRDVVFQSNPFSYPFLPGISVASENTKRKIIHSRGAIKGMFESVGLLETCRFLGREIICAGTTLADFETMLKYLDRLTSGIRRRFFYALLDGIDQGLHTYFAHQRVITPLHCYTNWNGPFLTMDREVVLPQNKNHEGYLCNQDGSVIPIVHQYDRVKSLYRPDEKRPACWALYPGQGHG
jgi:hypothetical protein